jgi:Transcriptional regulator PadR-like family
MRSAGLWRRGSGHRGHRLPAASAWIRHVRIRPRAALVSLAKSRAVHRPTASSRLVLGPLGRLLPWDSRSGCGIRLPIPVRTLLIVLPPPHVADVRCLCRISGEVTSNRRITKQTERILATLLTNPSAEWWGAQIAPAAGLPSGTLYPALARMERFGWLASRWEEIEPAEEGRPRRRLYHLTRIPKQRIGTWFGVGSVLRRSGELEA